MKHIAPVLALLLLFAGVGETPPALGGEDGAAGDEVPYTPRQLADAIDALRNSAYAFDIKVEFRLINQASRFDEADWTADFLDARHEIKGVYIWKKRLDVSYMEAREFHVPDAKAREYKWFVTPEFARYFANDHAVTIGEGDDVPRRRGLILSGDQRRRTADHYLQMVWPDIETSFIGQFDPVVLRRNGPLLEAHHFAMNEATGFIVEDRAVFDLEHGLAPVEYFWSRRMADPAKGPDKKRWYRFGEPHPTTSGLYLPQWILIYDGVFDQLSYYALKHYADNEQVAEGLIDFVFPEGTPVSDRIANIEYHAGLVPPDTLLPVVSPSAAEPDAFLPVISPPAAEAAPSMPVEAAQMPFHVLPPIQVREADMRRIAVQRLEAVWYTHLGFITAGSGLLLLALGVICRRK